MFTVNTHTHTHTILHDYPECFHREKARLTNILGLAIAFRCFLVRMEVKYLLGKPLNRGRFVYGSFPSTEANVSRSIFSPVSIWGKHYKTQCWKEEPTSQRKKHNVIFGEQF